MNKTILGVALGLGALAIALGAFAAHGLREVLDERALDSFKTGVFYQLIHALFLLFLANTTHVSVKSKRPVFYLILVGVLFFSFSIYLLSTQVLTGFEPGVFALITPLGGILMIMGWIYLAYRVFKPLD